MNDEQRDKHNQYRSLTSAVILGWLIDQGCELTEETLSALPSLRAASPHWHPDMDKSADKTFIESSGGRVEIATDPSALLNVPVSQIIQTAKNIPTHSQDFSIEYRPFDGLVQQQPGKALEALTLESRQEKYPKTFWRPLLREWPDSAPPYLTCSLSEKLALLPADTVRSLRHDVFPWLRKNSPSLTSINQQHPLDVLDSLLDKLLTNDANTTSSTILDESADELPSRRTMFHAINGPIGSAVSFLFAVMDSQNLAPNSGVPPEIRSRLERLIAVPGEGSDHAVCLIARYVHAFYVLDPDWTSETIVPWFDPTHPNAEPAWNGFCFANTLPEPELFLLLKPYFLNVFSLTSVWRWRNDEFRALHQLLVDSFQQRELHETYPSADEIRAALRITNNDGRSFCIHYLAKLIDDDQDQWHRFGKRFLTEAWPKENHLRTERTTLSFVFLSSVAGNNFPDVVDTIVPRLVHVHNNNWLSFQILSRTNNNSNLVEKFPSESLTLINSIVPDNPHGTPFNLNSTLEKVAESDPDLRQDPKWQRLKRIARNV